MPRSAIGLLMLCAVAAPLSASADLAPPPGYKEKCTVKKQQKPGETCTACTDAYHRKPDACADKLAKEGYTRRCKTRGASTWTEVWCRPGKGKHGPKKGGDGAKPGKALEDPTQAVAPHGCPVDAGAEADAVEDAPRGLGTAGFAGLGVGVLLIGLALARRRAD